MPAIEAITPDVSIGMKIVFWFGEFDFPPTLLDESCALSLGFGPFSLIKKSLVFRNSKFGSSATGNGVTFSTTWGSSRTPLPGAEAANKVKIRSAAVNLTSVIKRVIEAGVNAERKGLNRMTDAMEPTQVAN